MNPIALLLVALAMSTDAFAAAIGKGASLNRPSLSEALRIGLIFGSIEAITPLIGWLLRPHFLGLVSGTRAAAEYFAPQADDRMWSPINRLLGRHYEWVSRLL